MGTNYVVWFNAITHQIGGSRQPGQGVRLRGPGHSRPGGLDGVRHADYDTRAMEVLMWMS